MSQVEKKEIPTLLTEQDPRRNRPSESKAKEADTRRN